MASLLASPPETFTGTDGATPNTANTVIGLNEGTGGSWQIGSNQGRLRTGTVQYNRTSSRVVVAARQDMELLFDWVIPTPGTLFSSVYMRHSTTSLDGASMYYFSLERDAMTIGRSTAYSGTDIATKTYTGRTAGQVMRTRIAVFGNTMKARTWLASASEDTGTWDLSVTDNTVTAAGYFGWTNSSATTGSKDFFVDNVNAFDTETPTQKRVDLTGSITPGGVLTKTVPKIFAGSITSSGVVDRRRLVARVFAGSITMAGTVARRASKLLDGSVAISGALVKVPKKALAGSITPSATLFRRVAKRLGGTISAFGNLTAINAGRAFGVPGLAVMTIRKAGAVRARIRKG